MNPITLVKSVVEYMVMLCLFVGGVTAAVSGIALIMYLGILYYVLFARLGFEVLGVPGMVFGILLGFGIMMTGFEVAGEKVV